jgi:hypothetical protein
MLNSFQTCSSFGDDQSMNEKNIKEHFKTSKNIFQMPPKDQGV